MPLPCPRVDPELQGPCLAADPVPGPDGGRMQAHHDGAPLLHRFPGPRRLARHRRVSPPVEDEDEACAAPGVAGASPVTPAGAWLLSRNLAIRVPVRPVSCLARRACRRTFEGPGPGKRPGAGLRRMVQGRLDRLLLSRAGQHGLSGRGADRSGVHGYGMSRTARKRGGRSVRLARSVLPLAQMRAHRCRPCLRWHCQAIPVVPRE